jgi:hypothetical protein
LIFSRHRAWAFPRFRSNADDLIQPSEESMPAFRDPGAKTCTWPLRRYFSKKSTARNKKLATFLSFDILQMIRN